MKNDKALWGSISILIGAVIAIMALIRGAWQIWLLLGVFALWGIWVTAVLLLPLMRQAQRRRKYQMRLKERQKEQISEAPLDQGMENGGEPMDLLLLRHANYRISSYLRGAYPDVTWEWCIKNPERLVRQGGVGRIRIFGVTDFDHADITIDRKANITCDMIKIVPLSAVGADAGADANMPPNRQPVDPQIWFEVTGRKVLESLMADLNSRGHTSLTLHEDGEICIEQDKDEVAQEHLSNFPEKVYWPRLIQVFERNGLAAEITSKGIQVSW